jgi:hypothetical protein
LFRFRRRLAWCRPDAALKRRSYARTARHCDLSQSSPAVLRITKDLGRHLSGTIHPPNYVWPRHPPSPAKVTGLFLPSGTRSRKSQFLKTSAAALVSKIDSEREREAANLSSAIRVYVVEYYRFTALPLSDRDDG